MHAMRLLSELREGGGLLAQIARKGLRDHDAQVRRAAADALGQHPEFDDIRPLLDLHQEAPKSDTHLIHVVRMALRAAPGGLGLGSVGRTQAEQRDARDIADVATGVPTAVAASCCTTSRGLRSRSRSSCGTSITLRSYGESGTAKALATFVRAQVEFAEPKGTAGSGASKALTTFVKVHSGMDLTHWSRWSRQSSKGPRSAASPLPRRCAPWHRI